ncbi:DUF2147 domain-containing protein [Acinetobacter sp. HY1485]|uniref:DUF2147 domain-containing protein n=1 Tax=Acinetobacter sp. HY1485 TaxID=2970918 RepID=UPI0022B947BB|nr:DUF2147 domain-containing protein [Acinetobacter sp. HY1485]
MNFKYMALLVAFITHTACAEDISGVWKQFDDKTGSSKAMIELTKDKAGLYTGKILKVTPREGYKPKETCVKCPAPYTNQPIIGLDLIHNLKETKPGIYEGGRIIDPLTGKMYDLKGKISANHKQLQLRGYIGTSMLGRTQVWFKQD